MERCHACKKLFSNEDLRVVLGDFYCRRCHETTVREAKRQLSMHVDGWEKHKTIEEYRRSNT